MNKSKYKRKKLMSKDKYFNQRTWAALKKYSLSMTLKKWLNMINF